MGAFFSRGNQLAYQPRLVVTSQVKYLDPTHASRPQPRDHDGYVELLL